MQSGLILVTGAKGFVGRHLCRSLARRGYQVRGTLRADPPASAQGMDQGTDYAASGDIGPETDWRAHLAGVEAVVHAAALVHRRGQGQGQGQGGADPMALYRRVNVAASLRLARQAAEAGVRRFVFLSSIKAGEAARNPEAPDRDPYELSKLEAEAGLAEIARDTGLELVVLRPPLVYGPDAAANFALLARAVAKGLPLPLGSIRNRRSFVYVGNLCDAIAACLAHPQAAGGVFEPSDGPPLSTPAFVRAIGRAQGRRVVLLPCPPTLLRGLGRVLGKGPAMDSLTRDLVAEDAPLRDRLGWHAPLSLEQALAATFAAPSPEAP